MALITGNLGIAFEVQSAEKVFAPGLDAILGTPIATITEAQGAVLGDISTGIGESGIDFQLERTATERPTVTGSRTRQFDELLTAGVASMSFAWPMAGSRRVITVGEPAADYRFFPGFGIDSLYESAGLEAADGTSSVLYTPIPTKFISALVWDGDPLLADCEVFAFIDLLANYDSSLPPSEAGIQTNTFTGKLDRSRTGAYGLPFPTFDYGLQVDGSADIVAEASNRYDVATPLSRGWSDFTLTIDNGIDTPLDANGTDGVRIEQTARDISLSVTIDQESSDQDFDYQQLIRETTALLLDGQMDFTVGDPAVENDRATAYKMQLFGLNPQDFQLAQPARARSTTLTAFLTSDVADGEFILTFL